MKYLSKINVHIVIISAPDVYFLSFDSDQLSKTRSVISNSKSEIPNSKSSRKSILKIFFIFTILHVV